MEIEIKPYLLYILFLSFIGCQERAPNFIDIEYSSANIIKGKAISVSEMIEFGNKMALYFKNAQVDSLLKLVDQERFKFRVINKSEIDPKYINNLRLFIEKHFD